MASGSGALGLGTSWRLRRRRAGSQRSSWSCWGPTGMPWWEEGAAPEGRSRLRMEQPPKPQWEWGEPRQNGLRGPSHGRGEQQPFAGAKGGGSRWDSSCLGMSRARVRLVRRLSEQETGGLWTRRIWFCWGRWGSCCSPADPHCCEKHRRGGSGTLALFPTAGRESRAGRGGRWGASLSWSHTVHPFPGPQPGAEGFAPRLPLTHAAISLSLGVSIQLSLPGA